MAAPGALGALLSDYTPSGGGLAVKRPHLPGGGSRAPLRKARGRRRRVSRGAIFGKLAVDRAPRNRRTAAARLPPPRRAARARPRQRPTAPTRPDRARRRAAADAAGLILATARGAARRSHPALLGSPTRAAWRGGGSRRCGGLERSHEDAGRPGVALAPSHVALAAAATTWLGASSPAAAPWCDGAGEPRGRAAPFHAPLTADPTAADGSPRGATPGGPPGLRHAARHAVVFSHEPPATPRASAGG